MKLSSTASLSFAREAVEAVEAAEAACGFKLTVYLLVLALQTKEDEDGVQIIPKLEYCRSEHMTLFVSCIYVYKGLLMVSGVHGALRILRIGIFSFPSGVKISLGSWKLFPLQ